MEQLLVDVRVARRIDASPERVFDAWLDPERARRFLFATPTGEMVRAEIDPRLRGRYCLVDRREGTDVEHRGEYLALDRPRRLVFSFWVSGFHDQVSRVAIDIVPAGAGADITLTNGPLPAEWAERAREGWAGILDGLAATTE